MVRSGFSRRPELGEERERGGGGGSADVVALGMSRFRSSRTNKQRRRPARYCSAMPGILRKRLVTVRNCGGGALAPSSAYQRRQREKKNCLAPRCRQPARHCLRTVSRWKRGSEGRGPLCLPLRGPCGPCAWPGRNFLGRLPASARRALPGVGGRLLFCRAVHWPCGGHMMCRWRGAGPATPGHAGHAREGGTLTQSAECRPQAVPA